MISWRLRPAALIFDLEDRYARERGVHGRHPRPLGEVRFHLLGAAGGEPLAAPKELAVRRNPSGFDVWFDELRRPDGTHQRSGLAEGTYAVRVTSDFYQIAEQPDVELPQPAQPSFLDLLPGYRYPFPRVSTLGRGRGPTLLRGGLHRADGGGVEDVRVEAEGALYGYRTDPTGQWVLVFPDQRGDGDVTVRFVQPDGAVSEAGGVPVLQGRDNSLPQTALRGTVLDERGIAVAGAVVEVAGHRGRSRTGPDGGWGYYFDLDQAAAKVGVTITAPDGRRQALSEVEIRPRSTVAVPTLRCA